MTNRAGQLSERVVLRRKVTAPDDYGTLVETINDYATVWAHIRPMSGRERDRAQQTEATANYVVTIRNRSDVLEKDVVIWRGTEYNVRFVSYAGPRERHMSLEVERGAP